MAEKVIQFNESLNLLEEKIYSDVKNPFALRDGRIITISDLNDDEHGLSCNSVCPFCHDRFEARLGEKRIHHFAHTGEGCDQISAYLTGLYSFIKEFLSSGEQFPIPELGISFYVGTRPLSIDGAPGSSRITYGKEPGMHYRFIHEAFFQSFESCDLIVEKNKRPSALIAHFKGKRLAFVIKPPKTICNDFIAKPYEDIATIEINLNEYGNEIKSSTTSDLRKLLCAEGICSWLYSPSVEKEIQRINEERAEKRSEEERIAAERQERERLAHENYMKQKEEQEKKDAEERQKKLLEEQKRQAEAERKAEQTRLENKRIENEKFQEWEQSKRIQKKPSPGRKMRTCFCCKQEKDKDDVKWGKKTKHFYCIDCQISGKVNYREI